VTTAKDPEGRPTVFENLPKDLPRVISVGRLDLNSEGLLLLTNDGELARKLELPATGWVRRYRVRVNGRIDPASLARLAEGIEVEGVRYGSIEAILDRQQGGNAWLTMSLTEGKNREIRKVCAFFGWTVSRLIRLSYGPFQLGHLERGEIEEVPGKVLRDQIGQPGAPQPLRPHQGSGGKARPPKPRNDEASRPSRGKADSGKDGRPGRDDRQVGRGYTPRGRDGKREDRRGLDSHTDPKLGDTPPNRNQRAGKQYSTDTVRPGRPNPAWRGEDQRRDEPSRGKAKPQRNRQDAERAERGQQETRLTRRPRGDSAGPAGREDARRSSEKQSRNAAAHAARQDKYQTKGGKPVRAKRPEEPTPQASRGRPDRPAEMPRRQRTAEVEPGSQMSTKLTLAGGRAAGPKRDDTRGPKAARGAGPRKDANRQRRP
jgi:23S rRNA pseudouridine2605 synthase